MASLPPAMALDGAGRHLAPRRAQRPVGVVTRAPFAATVDPAVDPAVEPAVDPVQESA